MNTLDWYYEDEVDRPMPPHEVRDDDKLYELVSSMERDGWVGRPVLMRDEIQAVTGSHRIAAARLSEIEVPVVYIDKDLDADFWDEFDAATDDDDRLRVLEDYLGADHVCTKLMADEIQQP